MRLTEMTKIALIAAAFGAVAEAHRLHKDKDEDTEEADMYKPVQLNGWQMEQFEKKKQAMAQNPDAAFGFEKIGFFNQRGSVVEGDNDGDKEPK